MRDATFTVAATTEYLASGNLDMPHFYGFMDDLRRQWDDRLVAYQPAADHGPEALAIVAALIEIIGREKGVTPPDWAAPDATTLPDPYFVVKGHSRAAITLILLNTHPAFHIRNVFVHRNILQRV